MICHVTNMCYIKLAANSCQIFIMLNLQPETTQWKVAPPPPPSPPPQTKGILQIFCEGPVLYITRTGCLFVL